MNELSMRSTVCSKVEKEAHFAPEALIVVPSMVSVRTLDSPISMEIMVCRTDSLFTGGHGSSPPVPGKGTALSFS